MEGGGGGINLINGGAPDNWGIGTNLKEESRGACPSGGGRGVPGTTHEGGKKDVVMQGIGSLPRESRSQSC